MDANSHVVDINPRFQQLFGYSLDEIRGKYINQVVVPEDLMEEAEELDKKALKGYTYYDTVRKTKGGALVPVSISAAPIITEGTHVGKVGVYKDISQLKRAEKTLKEALNKSAVLNEKLGVVGRLTRHDVRNKLSAITGNIYLATQKMPSREISEHLQAADSAVSQIVKILDFASVYEKLGVEELSTIDVGKAVDEAVSLFSDLSAVKVVNECHGLTVLADSLLRQLFYNLIHNSLVHGERVSQIGLSFDTTYKDAVKLVYEDNGVGIPKADKERVFEKGFGKGTGLGLFLIRKICAVYGWTIRETGKEGYGAKFTIAIPRDGSDGTLRYEISRQTRQLQAA
jgi:PAS domain S-box-containing protein